MLIHVSVIPKSGRSELKLDGENLKIWLKSSPEDGKANKELVLVLAKIFGVSRSAVSIVRGITSRKKSVDILGVTLEDLKKILL